VGQKLPFAAHLAVRLHHPQLAYCAHALGDVRLAHVRQTSPESSQVPLSGHHLHESPCGNLLHCTAWVYPEHCGQLFAAPQVPLRRHTWHSGVALHAGVVSTGQPGQAPVTQLDVMEHQEHEVSLEQDVELALDSQVPFLLGLQVSAQEPSPYVRSAPCAG
jgi:hypothetical protein